MTKTMPGKRRNGSAGGPERIDSELLKLDFGSRFVDFSKLAAGSAGAEGPPVRKLAPKPGRAPLPTAHPPSILNLKQPRRDQDS